MLSEFWGPFHDSTEGLSGVAVRDVIDRLDETLGEHILRSGQVRYVLKFFWLSLSDQLGKTLGEHTLRAGQVHLLPTSLQPQQSHSPQLLTPFSNYSPLPARRRAQQRTTHALAPPAIPAAWASSCPTRAGVLSSAAPTTPPAHTHALSALW